MLIFILTVSLHSLGQLNRIPGWSVAGIVSGVTYSTRHVVGMSDVI